MKAPVLACAALALSQVAFSHAAFAGIFDSIETRQANLEKQLAGNNSYHAWMARELAEVAVDEKSQHDLDVARKFMNMAESHAARAGGAK